MTVNEKCDKDYIICIYCREHYYRELAEAIFCSIRIFNKPKVGELQRMTVKEFLKNYDQDDYMGECIKAIPPTEIHNIV